MKNYSQWKYIKENYKFEIAYRIKNKFEFDDLFRKLKSEGYETYFAEEYCDYYQIIWLHIDEDSGDKFATASDMEFYDTYEDFWHENPKPELIDYDFKYKKITKEEDPFGEEDWGYEKIDEQENYTFTTGEKVRAKTRTDHSHMRGGNGEGVIRDVLRKSVGILWDNGMLELCGNEEIEPLIIRKRKLNLDDDPFGEENWGYVQESNEEDVGDRRINLVEIYEKFNKDRKKVSEYLTNLLKGKTVEFRYYDENIGEHLYSKGEIIEKVGLPSHYVFTCVGGKIYKRISLHDPVIYYEGKKKAKKLNLEDDPFGEEDWGYLAEQKKDFITFEDLVFEDFPGLANSFRCGIKLNNGCYVSIVHGPHFRCDAGTYEVWYKNPEGEWLDDTLNYQTEEDINNLLIELQSRKKKEKKLNPEDDPFGEENWGYVQESVIFDELKVGDRVYTEDRNILPSKAKGVFENDKPIFIGTITRLDRGNETIYVIWDGCGNSDYHASAHSKRYITLYNKKKKILNLEDDPFGEENWGYMEESYSFDDFKVGDIVDITYDGAVRIHGNLGLSIEDYMKVRSNGIIKDVRRGDEFPIYVVWNYGSSWYQVKDLEPKTKRKRKLNLDDDPFGEENWGFIQESVNKNFRIGDTVKLIIGTQPFGKEDREWWLEEQVKYDGDVKIFNLRKKYHDLYEYDEPRYENQVKFLNFLKKELIDNFVVFESFDEQGFSTKISEIKNIQIIRGRIIFIDVEEKKYYVKSDSKITYYPKNIKKITNSELDPFDEENWGYEEI